MCYRGCCHSGTALASLDVEQPLAISRRTDATERSQAADCNDGGPMRSWLLCPSSSVSMTVLSRRLCRPMLVAAPARYAGSLWLATPKLSVEADWALSCGRSPECIDGRLQRRHPLGVVPVERGPRTRDGVIRYPAVERAAVGLDYHAAADTRCLRGRGCASTICRALARRYSLCKSNTVSCSKRCR